MAVFILHTQSVLTDQNTSSADATIGDVYQVTDVDPLYYELLPNGGGGGGAVNSVTSGNANITIGGTASDPTVAVTTGTFDAAGAAAAAAAASDPLGAAAAAAAASDPLGTAAAVAAASIPKSIVDAAGDLITATADNTPSRLALGLSNGILTSTGSALSWSANPAGRAAILTDGATVGVDAGNARLHTLTTVQNPTILAPTNGANGRPVILRITASGGDRTVTLTTGSTNSFNLGSFVLTPTPSGTTDYIGTMFNSATSRFDVLAYVKGY